jgi:hypothetical protein
MTRLRSAALLLLALGACGGTPKTTIPVESPLRPFTPPEPEAAPAAQTPTSQPAEAPK